MHYESRKTGPVTTTVQVRPFETFVVAVVLGVIGGAAIMTLTPGGIIAGLIAVWAALGIAGVSVRQIKRAMAVFRS